MKITDPCYGCLVSPCCSHSFYKSTRDVIKLIKAIKHVNAYIENGWNYKRTKEYDLLQKIEKQFLATTRSAIRQYNNIKLNDITCGWTAEIGTYKAKVLKAWKEE